MKRGIKTGPDRRDVDAIAARRTGLSRRLWSDFVGLGSTFAKEKPAEGRNSCASRAARSLTDPPNGYRTPSPDQPYGLNYRHDKKR